MKAMALLILLIITLAPYKSECQSYFKKHNLSLIKEKSIFFKSDMPSKSILFKKQKPFNSFSLKGDPKTPGDELIIYSRHYYIGLGLMVGGSIVGAIGAANFSTPASMIGFVGILVGAVFQLESHTHIANAGKMMNEQKSTASNRVKINSDENGIGLAYSLSSK